MTELQVGQRVRLIYGPFKGHFGHVRDAGYTETTALIELDGGLYLNVQAHKLSPVPEPGISTSQEPTMTTTETPTLSHTAVASIPLPGGHEPTIENPVVVPHGWTVVNVADGRVWIRRVVG